MQSNKYLNDSNSFRPESHIFVSSLPLNYENKKCKISLIKLDIKAERVDIENLSNRQNNHNLLFMLSHICHLLREPLNNICGSLQIIQNIIKKDTHAHAIINSHLSISKNTSELMQLLLTNIEDYSQSHRNTFKLRPQFVNIRELINQCIALVEDNLANKKINLILDIMPNLPVHGFIDSNRFKEVLLILLLNAMKYTIIGNITLKIGEERETSYIYCSVSDTGIGIKEPDRSKLFMLFGKVYIYIYIYIGR